MNRQINHKSMYQYQCSVGGLRKADGGMNGPLMAFSLA